MSNEKQAFPNGYHGEEHKGMTLRDYFAARAMQCMGELKTKPYSNLQPTAEMAYQMADAMMKVRSGNS
jgi:hypothetical protein